jgi:NAD-dependent deacetylase
MDARLSAVAARLRTAGRITALTGAGISAGSGVPTFRGPAGLWKSFRPEDLATPQAFFRDPQLVWEWYDWRRSLIAKCEPNAAHGVLARWSRREGFTLITQNVDGLHERADTRNVIRYHGSIWRVRCAAGCGVPEWEDLRVPLSPLPPRCSSCAGVARPGVVWFGEAIPAEAARAAHAATTCEVFLSIGTSSLVYPAAGLLDEARGRGAYTVEINPEPTASAESVDLAIAMPAEEALPLIEMAGR